jgi:hypothetical protein
MPSGIARKKARVDRFIISAAEVALNCGQLDLVGMDVRNWRAYSANLHPAHEGKRFGGETKAAHDDDGRL